MILKTQLLFALKDNPLSLQSLYDLFSHVKPSTIRGRLNENVGDIFIRVDKGVYVACADDFDVVLADPPWQYQKDAGRGKASSHYALMPLEHIMNLPVGDVCKPDSVLFLWATFPLLEEALQVMRSWGFTYKTAGFIWVKLNNDGTPFLGTGNYTRSNAEVCLIGTKGKGLERLNKKISSVMFSARRTHSTKPLETYKRIEELYGPCKRLELFSRHQRQGWKVWGDQASKETQKTLCRGMIEHEI